MTSLLDFALNVSMVDLELKNVLLANVGITGIILLVLFAMNHKEKILIFRTCGMVLWVLKEIVYHSRINESNKTKITTKIDSLIRPMTTHINELQSRHNEN